MEVGASSGVPKAEVGVRRPVSREILGVRSTCSDEVHRPLLVEAAQVELLRCGAAPDLARQTRHSDRWMTADTEEKVSRKDVEVAMRQRTEGETGDQREEESEEVVVVTGSRKHPGESSR